MPKTLLTLLLFSFLLPLAPPASAQGFIKKDTHDLPDASHYYKARQQITITDDSPIINDQRTNPAAAGANGGLPTGPRPLPKAGWQPYSSSVTGGRSDLPQVNNGVPPKMPASPPPGPSGMHGHAGNLKARPAAAKPSPNSIKTYKAYKGYGAGVTPPAGAGAGSSGTSTSTAVQGSILHWNRRH